MTYCNHVHQVGYVSNIDLADKEAIKDRSRAMLSQTTCAREKCEKAAARAVIKATRETPYFYPFTQSRPDDYVPREIRP